MRQSWDILKALKRSWSLNISLGLIHIALLYSEKQIGVRHPTLWHDWVTKSMIKQNRQKESDFSWFCQNWKKFKLQIRFLLGCWWPTQIIHVDLHPRGVRENLQRGEQYFVAKHCCLTLEKIHCCIIITVSR